MWKGRSAGLAGAASILVLSLACESAERPADTLQGPEPGSPAEALVRKDSALPNVGPSTPEDSAAFLAQRDTAPRGVKAEAILGVPVSRDDIVHISVVSTNCAAGDNAISVSGPVSQVLFSDACHASGSVSLGPMPDDGLLVFTIIGPTWGTGDFRMSGEYPSYTLYFDDGFGDGDYNDVVLAAVIEGGKPELRCDPSPVMRGQTVRCSLTARRPFKVLRQWSKVKGFNRIEETPNAEYPAGGLHVWEGPAMTNSSVSMEVETRSGDGSTKKSTASAKIDVIPRSWPAPQLNPPQKVIGLREGMRDYPDNKLFGNAGPVLPTMKLFAIPVLRAPSGPNKGLAILADPLPAVEYSIYLHPALYNRPGAGDMAQHWHEDQNGQGSGTCTQAVFSTLTPEAERHEGVTMAPDSHWGITNDFYQTSNIQEKIEQLVTDRSDRELHELAYNTFAKLHTTGTHKKRQTEFDNKDRPAIYNKLQCTLDYNPKDK